MVLGVGQIPQREIIEPACFLPAVGRKKDVRSVHVADADGEKVVQRERDVRHALHALELLEPRLVELDADEFVDRIGRGFEKLGDFLAHFFILSRAAAFIS